MEQQHGFPKAVINESIKTLGVADIRNVASENSQLYQAFNKFTITAGTTKKLGLTMPANKQIRIFPATIVSSVDKLTFKVYEGSTFTGGTVVSSFNQDRNSTDTSDVILTEDPTVTVNGTQFVQAYLPGSTGVGQTRTGANSGGETFWKFKPNTKYVVELVNDSLSDNIVQITHVWIEGWK